MKFDRIVILGGTEQYFQNGYLIGVFPNWIARSVASWEKKPEKIRRTTMPIGLPKFRDGQVMPSAMADREIFDRDNHIA